jgi:hypothetical protein
MELCFVSFFGHLELFLQDVRSFLFVGNRKQQGPCGLSKLTHRILQYSIDRPGIKIFDFLG